MLRSALQMVFLLGLAALCIGWFSLPEKRTPGLHCSEPIWSLGILKSEAVRDSHRHKFVLKNTSGRQLKVAVRSSCGCLVPDFPESIAVGENKVMEVVFNPPALPGPFEKRVDIHWSSESVEGITTLWALGEVAAESVFHTIPKTVHFGTVSVLETSEKDLYLCTYTGDAIGAVNLADEQGRVVTVNTEEVSEMERVLVKLQFIARESGYIQGMFELSVEKQGSVWVPYEAIVTP